MLPYFELGRCCIREMVERDFKCLNLILVIATCCALVDAAHNGQDKNVDEGEKTIYFLHLLCDEEVFDRDWFILFLFVSARAIEARTATNTNK